MASPPLAAARRHRRGPTPEQAIGVIALLPFALLWLVALVLPTVATVATGLTRTTVLLGRTTFAGLANYGALLGSRGFGHVVAITLLGALAQAVAVAVVPPLLAAAAASLAPSRRLPVRLAFTLPVAMASPVAVALTLWGISGADLANPVLAPLALIRTQALYALLVACGIGLVAYVAALRVPPPRSPWRALASRPFAIVWAVTVLATLAWSLQSAGIAFLATAGGPAHATTTLGLLAFDLALRSFQFGPGAAAASIQLIAVAALGTLAGLIVVAGRIRITVAAAAPAAGGSAVAAGVVIGLCAVLLLAGVLPLIGNTFAPANAFARAARSGFAPAMLHTLWPTVLQVPVVLALVTAAAAGIGLLRPLGEHSEWLLLPFSPWLFVTVEPLSPSAYLDFVRTGGPAGLVTSLWPVAVYAVPLLFPLTLLFAGLAPRWREARLRGMPDAFLRAALLPAAPVALALGAVLAWIGFHDLDWSLVSTTRPSASNGPLWIALLRGGASVDRNVLHAALTLFELPLVIAFVAGWWAFQAFYADRLAIWSEPALSEPAPVASPPR